MSRTGDREMSHLFSGVLEMQSMQVRCSLKNIRGRYTAIREVNEGTWKRIVGFKVGDLVKTPYGIGLIQEHANHDYVIFFLFPPICSKVLDVKSLGLPNAWEKRIALHKGLWIAQKYNWRRKETRWILKR
jgi:hypothetical protein